MTSWAHDEVDTADLGDRRLNARFGKVLERVGEHPRESLPAACGGWTETQAAYRFFDNDKTTFEKVLAPHRDATVERIAVAPVALLVQDTTEHDELIDFGPKGIGTVRRTQKRQRRLHPTVAFTPERICLGTVAAAYWARDEPSPRAERRGKGIDEKESRHWIESYQESCAVQAQAPDTLVVSVGDREGDIYELFVEAESYSPETRAEWIVRAGRDRLLPASADPQAPRTLYEAADRAPVVGGLGVEASARPGRAARQARVTLRATRVRLAAPRRGRDCRLPECVVGLVLAREESPPPDVEPLEWLLLTSLPVETFEQAATVVEWYAVRWAIEVFFFVFKHGCQIEKLQLETEARQLPALGLYMIVAWRVLYALMLGRRCPDIDCEAVFERCEWQAAYLVVHRCAPPAEPPTLGEMVLLIATLGGYLGRKHDGPPGPKTLWVGMQRMREFAIALEAREAVERRCA